MALGSQGMPGGVVCWDKMRCERGVRVSGLGMRLGGGDLWDPQDMRTGEQGKTATSILLQSWG